MIYRIKLITYADLFAERLLYDDNSSVSNLTTQKQYNGNIASAIINRRTDGTSTTTKSAYGFTYDGLNRLNEATYAESTGSGYTVNLNAYNEFGITYDKNGNILTLKRNSAGTFVDNLGYTYENLNKSNRLQAVADNSGNAIGFTDIANTSDYLYDNNGNATKDLNKGITAISYNVLNLPNTVTKDANNSITYTYTASGEKVMQATKVSGTTTNRYYAGFSEYDNLKALSLLKMDEGIVTKTSSAYNYEYYLKDHLGNTRITFRPGTTGPDLSQRTDYYPFGLAFTNQYIGSTGNSYLYNGKELQNELGWQVYDYGARFYDPSLGRWHSVDPLCEVNRRWSPYRYAYNNPLRFIDPDGMLEEVYINGTEAEQATKELQKSTSLTLSRDSNTGKISATGTAQTKGDKLLLQAINSTSVKVNVTATSNTTTSTGNLYIGGAFMGNTVGQVTTQSTRMIGKDDPITTTSTSTVATAEQEVNPGVLENMSTAHGKPGADMLHEVTEGYQGGVISLGNGVSSPVTGSGSVYQQAHSKATNQSGVVTQRIYDSSGNPMQMTPSGGYPAGVKSADWYVKDKSGNTVVIQKLK